METFTTLAVKEFIFLYNGYSNHPFLLYGLQNNKSMPGGGLKKSCPACLEKIFNGCKVCPICKTAQPQHVRLNFFLF